MESGKLYKSNEIWKAHHNSAIDPSISSSLLRTLYGCSTSLPTTTIFAEETQRLITARQNATKANIDLIKDLIEKIYNHIQEKSFRAVCQSLKQHSTLTSSPSTSAPFLAPNISNTPKTMKQPMDNIPNFLPSIFVYGALESVDNTIYFRKLEEKLIEEVYV